MKNRDVFFFKSVFSEILLTPSKRVTTELSKVQGRVAEMMRLWKHYYTKVKKLQLFSIEKRQMLPKSCKAKAQWEQPHVP